MRTVRTRGEDGVAAVEMALVTTLLLLLGFGALPLYSLARAYQETNKASGAAVRYAASVDANGARSQKVDDDGQPVVDLSGNPVLESYSRRPTGNQVRSFARQTVGDRAMGVTTEVCAPDLTGCTVKDPRNARSGDGVRVTVSKVVDLGPGGSLANALGSLVGAGDFVPDGNVTISSTATGREE